MTTLQDLFGEQLIEHNKSGDGLNQIQTNELKGKFVAIYFSSVSST
jgi:hypothetical protein